MNLKIVMASLIALSTFTYAEPKESFLFLEKINKLEILLNVTVKDAILGYIFPDKHFLKETVSKDSDDYGSYMRRAAVSMKSSDSHKILTYLAESKNILEGINISTLSIKKLEDIVDNTRVIEDEFGNISTKRLLALSPSQYINFSLDEIAKMAQRATVEYLMLRIDNMKNKQSDKILKHLIASMDENIQLVSNYGYWNEEQKKFAERIRSLWDIQKTHLVNTELPLVVDIGSEQIRSVVNEFKKTTIK